jgi:ABC-type nitrate/sulfonate/bicarbonate transport system permease component
VVRILKSLAPWALACGLLFGSWQVLLGTGAVRPELLPPVGTVLAAAAKLVASAEFQRHAWVTV